MHSLATVMGPSAHQLRHRKPGRLVEDSDGVEVQRERWGVNVKRTSQFVPDALIQAMQEQQMQLAGGTARLAAIPMLQVAERHELFLAQVKAVLQPGHAAAA